MATGNVIPDANVNVVVSGSAFAENAQSVRAAQHAGGTGGELGLMTVGTFTSQPYSASILEVEREMPPVDDTPPPPPAEVPIVVLPETPKARELRFSVNDTVIGGVNNAFVFVPNRDDESLVVGMMSVEAFFNALLDDETGDASFSAANNQISITGRHAGDGTLRTITMNIGATQATINNIPTDIATFAGNSGPWHSISPHVDEAGNLYLPLRFVSNAFGFKLEVFGSLITLG